MRYNGQYENWANFEYDSSVIDQIVIRFALETGELKGMIEEPQINTKVLSF